MYHHHILIHGTLKILEHLEIGHFQGPTVNLPRFTSWNIWNILEHLELPWFNHISRSSAAPPSWAPSSGAAAASCAGPWAATWAPRFGSAETRGVRPQKCRKTWWKKEVFTQKKLKNADFEQLNQLKDVPFWMFRWGKVIRQGFWAIKMMDFDQTIGETYGNLRWFNHRRNTKLMEESDFRGFESFRWGIFNDFQWWNSPLKWWVSPRNTGNMKI